LEEVGSVATCSITDPFEIDAITFYKTVDAAKAIAEDIRELPSQQADWKNATAEETRKLLNKK
jgi:hypothetical protein